MIKDSKTNEDKSKIKSFSPFGRKSHENNKITNSDLNLLKGPPADLIVKVAVEIEES